MTQKYKNFEKSSLCEEENASFRLLTHRLKEKYKSICREKQKLQKIKNVALPAVLKNVSYRDITFANICLQIFLLQKPRMKLSLLGNL